MGAIAIVLGTRSEMIKQAPLAKALGDRARILHTGQDFDGELSSGLLAELGLRRVAGLAMVGGRPRAEQIGLALTALDEYFTRRRPSAVVVHGGTNAAVAGALAANARRIPLVHVEAGLRSYDRDVPEEHNRVLVDHLADLLCAPTPGNVVNLRAESIGADRVRLTGSTVVDAVRRHLPSPAQRATVLRAHGAKPEDYVLATIHRPRNTEDRESLRAIVRELADIAAGTLPVLLSVHPRTREALAATGLHDALHPVIQLPPLPYGEFLSLASHAAVLVSDSGTIQEEVTVLKRPLVVVGAATERPESLVHFARLAAPGPGIGDGVREMVHARPDLTDLPCPYGEHATSRIVEAIQDLLARHLSR
ncbi:UDP-N-acetylglucosamine 2-epimerase (non-hydrolyzing) [Phytohabitans sp. ZYX-F-186]|uniref:UDP-N-acetylglucosamine 2-epimerase (Non-hydrolyzing) n=1 Tax=Phytohabitans maris TaxID=3071409 RepID=A0ABU0ZXF7_9ACTN|nr:UDP-N-acetylglucosamine 2-epimerase (non-hydrolyzing) [Phytohabitans sp. ZYX-F-186]MDQ7910989.1 UDP-N-acetylglucosamine 2-epimerase (non-hydrolyzing) [Phytohabitans sp. ZYX-F-186]